MTQPSPIEPEFRLGLPLSRRRAGPSLGLSLLLHGTLLGALVWVGAHLADSSGRGGGRRARGGAGSVNFFALPPGAPAEIELPTAPRPTLAPLAPLSQIKLDLPRVEIARDTAAIPVPGGAGGGGGGGGGGEAGGEGMGSGTGGEGDYICLATPRTAILPPLAKVPGSVAGRTYRIRFSVAADGRVTRVEVDPPIADDAYRREFLERMLAYLFYPARSRDGRNVACVVTVPLRIGH